MSTPNILTLSPIGVIHTPYSERYAAPRQSEASEQRTEGVIELFPGKNFEQALSDIEGFDKIWVLYWFHRNTTWKPKVLPPRGRVRRGLFATRSPHRPNPIGISAVTLLGVQGRMLTIENPDMLDGTPLIDIKPYVPYADAFPEARAGWLDALPQRVFTVVWSEEAAAQNTWLAPHTVDLRSIVDPLLQVDPFPHPYRRITVREDGLYSMACQSWRVAFAIEEDIVRVIGIDSGYTREQVETALGGTLHQQQAHRHWYGLPAL